jgi:hypothetical protein
MECPPLQKSRKDEPHRVRVSVKNVGHPARIPSWLRSALPRRPHIASCVLGACAATLLRSVTNARIVGRTRSLGANRGVVRNRGRDSRQASNKAGTSVAKMKANGVEHAPLVLEVRSFLTNGFIDK